MTPEQVADCAECHQPAPTPVRAEDEAAWLGKGAAQVYCGQACIDVRDEREQNADGAS